LRLFQDRRQARAHYAVLDILLLLVLISLAVAQRITQRPGGDAVAKTDAVIRSSIVNAVVGRKDDRVFHFLPRSGSARLVA